MLRQRLERGIRVLTGRDPHRDAGLRRGDELIRRFGELGSVDPEDRDRWLHPHAIGDPALADELGSGPETDLLAELGLFEVERIGLSARYAGDRHVALVVVKRRE